MMLLRTILCALALGVAPLDLGAAAQDARQNTQAEPQWTSLPFTSVADYERLIPIGMPQADVVAALGRPEAVMPGQANDVVFHYAYELDGGGQLRAVIILREDVVFIRRLYASTAAGGASRVN